MCFHYCNPLTSRDLSETSDLIPVTTSWAKPHISVCPHINSDWIFSVLFTRNPSEVRYEHTGGSPPNIIWPRLLSSISRGLFDLHSHSLFLSYNQRVLTVKYLGLQTFSFKQEQSITLRNLLRKKKSTHHNRRDRHETVNAPADQESNRGLADWLFWYEIVFTHAWDQMSGFFLILWQSHWLGSIISPESLALFTPAIVTMSEPLFSSCTLKKGKLLTNLEKWLRGNVRAFVCVLQNYIIFPSL